MRTRVTTTSAADMAVVAAAVTVVTTNGGRWLLVSVSEVLRIGTSLVFPLRRLENPQAPK